MYVVTGMSIERGNREVLSQHATMKAVDKWLNDVAKYCSSHYLFTVVDTEFKSENVRPVARASTIDKVISRQSLIALNPIDKAPEHLF